LHEVEATYHQYEWDEIGASPSQLPLFVSTTNNKSYQEYVQARRPEMLPPRYISDKPLARAYMIDDVVQSLLAGSALKPLFDLALSASIVPISNIRYGPGMGVIKPRDDVDVLGVFGDKLTRMIRDLRSVDDDQRATLSQVKLGDARRLNEYFAPDSASLMVTSPPYPGDHEYTKYSKLELLFRGYARTMDAFKVIKKRMLRASTTNLYKEDDDRTAIPSWPSIAEVTDLIQARLEEDGATSGFEKLYTKLVWEYFGGMAKALEECLGVLRPGGKIALLVSDSHAFKMVHIQTARILQEIGERIGFIDPEIVLWQLKTSTSHKYYLRENILILTKPRSRRKRKL